MAKRKTKLKTLAVSSLIALATIGVGAGGTFALFTDVDEARVTVQAGTVDIESNIAIKAAASLNAEDATTVAENKLSASFVNGGSATVDNELGTVALAKWTPGDTVTLETTPTNNSNVNTMVRLKIVMSGELASALVVEGLRNDTRELAMTGERTVVSDWVEVSPNEDIDAYDVKISFPDHDGGEVLFGTANKDNQYQGKEAQIQIFYEAVQANAKLDSTLEGINARLATEEINDGEKNHTMYDALLDLTEAQVTAIRESNYVWSQETDEFFAFSAAPADAYKYFKMYENMTAATEGYSIYAAASTWDATVDLNGKGFDAGDATGITTINYTNTDEARDVVIRTNSAETSLVVDDATTGSIYHYGSAGALNIIQCHTSSYHENGKVGFAEIAKGRIVLEEGSKIDHIHVNKKENVQEFDTVIIKDAGALALPSKITRDQVDVEEAKAVVTVETGNASETVYVYPYTDAQSVKTGTTEKTETQNTTISSALGQLVLDNGSDAGEKAMSNNAKEEIKEEKIAEAVGEEIDETGLYEARIGNVGYETLDAAVENIQAGETLVLCKDIVRDETVSVPVWTKPFNIDLNNHTYETLSVVGKSLSNMGYTASAFCFSYNGEETITIKNGTIKTKYGAAIYADEVKNMVLENVKLYQDHNNFSQDTKEYSSAVRITGNGTVTINSGTFEGYYALAASNSGGNFIINGGTFNGDLFFSSGTNSGVDKSFIINGGEFKNFNIVNPDKGNVVITGGKFDHDPSAYVGLGYSVNEDEGVYTVSVTQIIGGGDDMVEGEEN